MAQRSRRHPPSRRGSGGSRNSGGGRGAAGGREPGGSRPGSRSGSRRGGPPPGRPRSGGRRPPPRRGSDSSNGLIIGLVAIAVIGGGLLFALTRGGDKKKKGPAVPVVAETPRANADRDRGPSGPTKPPPPALTQTAKANAQEAAARIKAIAADARRHFRASQEAKSAGNDDLWQAELTRAKSFYDNANDIWNEIVGQMPESLPHWDRELVAEHWLSKEAQTLAKLVRDCPGISKQRR